MKKKILALSLTLALGLSLTACGGNSAPAASPPPTLRFWSR